MSQHRAWCCVNSRSKGAGQAWAVQSVEERSVYLQEVGAGGQVRLVELVWHVPPDGPKLAALLDQAVQVAQHEQQRTPLRPPDRIQSLLQMTMSTVTSAHSGNGPNAGPGPRVDA